MSEMYITLLIFAISGLTAILYSWRRRHKFDLPDLIRSDQLEKLAHQNDGNISILIDYHEKYMKNCLAKSHEQLGRKGAVCPFIPISLKKSTIYYKIIEATNFDDAASIVLKYKEVFLQLEPVSEPDAVYKTIIFVFTKLDEADAGPFIENLQKKLKPTMVKNGLMVGDFHPLSKLPGLHNPNFYSRAAPYPSLDIRYMIVDDFKFLAPQFLSLKNYKPEQVNEMLQSYIHHAARLTDNKNNQQILEAEKALLSSDSATTCK